MKTMLTLLAASAMLAFATPAAAQALQPGEVATDIAAIAEVVAGDAAWEQVWSGPMAADGMSVTPDGLLLFAQEQSNAIWKLWPDGRSFVEVPYVLGAGAVSMDAAGRMLAVERGCSDPGLMQLTCERRSAVVQLSPERKIIADAFADGTTLGRLNDLYADGRGGAWFTQGALYHTTADGVVTTVATMEAFSNGVVSSPDGRRLYVTDRTTVRAYDIDEDGIPSNARVFATLARDTQGFGGDGMEVDSQGRLYVTGDAGVYIFAPDGTELGVIPTPRRSITLALAGPQRNMLYIGTLGAATPAGDLWTPPHGERNIAMTIYRVPVLARGVR
ncbi:MAG: SMP-30/gluconolactonase/LRE family protein [Alteraurantiacibacter sp.]